MKEPLWLPREVILATQEALIERFGGLPGLRDEGLLDSALNRPRQLFHYANPSLHGLAAAYAHGVIKNHPFMDGNKRIGFMACYIFLRANGSAFRAAEEEVVVQTLGLAAGEITEADYAAWLAQAS